MSVPICDRCQNEHVPFAPCPDLGPEAVPPVKTRPSKKEYMRAYMRTYRARKRGAENREGT